MTSTRVAIYGTGRTASELARQLERSPYELVAVIAHDPANAGRPIASLVDAGPAHIRTTLDVDRVLRELGPDVMLYAGLGGEVLVDVMRCCLDAGADFINATFIHAATALGRQRADELAELARARGTRALGTGVNPGLWLDVLPALMGTACPGCPRVSARRVTDIRFWGADVLRNEVGVGQVKNDPPARFYGSLKESVLVLAEALAVELDEVSQTGKALVAADATQVADVVVDAGAIQGFDQTVVGLAGGEEVIAVRWIGLPNPQAEGLTPGIDLELLGADGGVVCALITPPSDPYPGTAARMIKSIRPLRELPPGLHSPAAIQRLTASGLQ